MHLSECGWCSDPVTAPCSGTPVVWLCVTPQTPPASPSMGFCRQDHWRVAMPSCRGSCRPSPGTEPASLTSPRRQRRVLYAGTTREGPPVCRKGAQDPRRAGGPRLLLYSSLLLTTCSALETFLHIRFSQALCQGVSIHPLLFGAVLAWQAGHPPPPLQKCS